MTCFGSFLLQVFFFKAQHKGGELLSDKEFVKDYSWLNKEELKDYLIPKYFNTLDRFVMEL